MSTLLEIASRFRRACSWPAELQLRQADHLSGHAHSHGAERKALRASSFARVCDFARDRKANIGLLTGLLAFPLLGVGGLAVDHMSAVSARNRLFTAGDAAALAAVNTAKNISLGRSTWGSEDPLALGTEAGHRVFSSNARDLGVANPPTPLIRLERAGGEFTATVTWSATMPATFGRVFQIESQTVSGRAQARTSEPLFQDVHIVMDMSASMLVGATEDDIRRNVQLTGCAFACHIQNENVTFVRQNGVRMRIDVMRDAIVAAVEEMRRRSEMPGQFRFAVHTFATRVETLLDINDPAARDYDNVIRVVRAAEPKRSNGAGTHFPTILNDLEPQFRTDGIGTSDRPMQRMIMVTDGVLDVRQWDVTGWRYSWASIPMTGPTYGGISNMNPRGCDRIKARGVEVSMVRVEYLLPTRIAGGGHQHPDYFNFIGDVLAPAMPTTMGACATSLSHYVTARTPQEIFSAISSAFTQSRRPVLTN